MEHVMEICQSVDISRQETAPSQKRLAENHEQDDNTSTSASYQAKVHEIEEDDQGQEEPNDDDEVNLEINKTMQKKPAIKTKSKIALLTMLPSNMYSSLSQEDKQVWGKLSAEGRAMIIKKISATNEPSSEERISSSHERIISFRLLLIIQNS